MKTLCTKLGRLFCVSLAIFCMSATWGFARPTTSDQAKRVVTNWLSLDRQPLGDFVGEQAQVKDAESFTDEAGNPLYYIVNLHPAGFVIVPGDDLVEPIIGFLSEGVYDPSPVNPLGALVSRDVPGRVAAARSVEQQVEAGAGQLENSDIYTNAQLKWAWLEDPAGTEKSVSGSSSISDVRVASFVQSRWSQTTVGGYACYNYYTPPFSSGSASNYPCGCVATAMAQLMRYWQCPTTGVGTASFIISIYGIETTRNLRGGDGLGGPYNWAEMSLVPSSGVTLSQRQAIGALTHDAGVSVNMSYTADGSGADTLQAAEALVSTFGYSNAKQGYNGSLNLPSENRNRMVNPNLDARYPVLFGITGSPGGHAIVCDGYGYNAATMYHHLNMGWAGSSDAWYNLPTIDTDIGTFTSVYKCIYNVYTTGSGEIISGRVTNTGGVPLSGVTVTAVRTGGGAYYTSTDANGIYALTRLPSSSSYTVTVSKNGYSFTSRSTSTGTSSNYTTTCGNVWGLDFVGGQATLPKALSPLYELLLME